LNNRVVPFFDENEVRLSRILTDRGTEYCGNPEHNEYELYLAVEDIGHSRTTTKSPQTASLSGFKRSKHPVGAAGNLGMSCADVAQAAWAIACWLAFPFHGSNSSIRFAR